MANVKIKGLKKAVGEYQRANAEGAFSSWYGKMMIDRDTGEVWTDTFYSLGQNEWKVYHDPAICDLIEHARWGREIRYQDVNMVNVRKWAEEAIKAYQAKQAKKEA